jgi:hypothetical protein
MTISIYNVAKAPMGWAIYCDGVKIGGVFGSKSAAFDAATVAASFKVQGGSGVQVNVPVGPGSDELPSD